MTKLRRPCANCPWRKDAPREHWDPQHFVDIARNCRDDGTYVMLCHKSKPLDDAKASAHYLTSRSSGLVCQGWARVEGYDAIGVRIAEMTGQLSHEEIVDRRGPKLFESFDAMLKANRIPIPPRNRRK